jgi:excisionase family DNA binding protein
MNEAREICSECGRLKAGVHEVYTEQNVPFADETRITVREACDELGLGKDSVEKYIRRGQLPAVITPTGYRIRIADVDLLRDRRGPGRPRKPPARKVQRRKPYIVE